MTALPNIPRLYTALAECLAVGIYALPLLRNPVHPMPRGSPQLNL